MPKSDIKIRETKEGTTAQYELWNATIVNRQTFEVVAVRQTKLSQFYVINDLSFVNEYVLLMSMNFCRGLHARHYQQSPKLTKFGTTS